MTTIHVPVCAFCGQPGGTDDSLDRGAHRGCLLDYEYDRVQAYVMDQDD